MTLAYSHRYRDADPAVQAANLARAQARLEYLRPSFRARGIHLWAPWIDLALAGVDEAAAWSAIGTFISMSGGILLDLDGAQESEGMATERIFASCECQTVEVLA